MSDLDIVAIATTLPGRAGDGTPEFVLTLAEAMHTSDVTIVAPRIRGGPRSERRARVKIRRVAYAPARFERVAEDAILPTIRRHPLLVLQLPGLLAGLWWRTWRESSREHTTLLHAHWVVPAGLIAVVVGRLRNLPVAITAHGADAYAFNGRLGRALKSWILGRCLVVYPVSKEIAQVLEPLAGDAVGPVLPMGVDVKTLASAADRRPHRGRVVFVGRLSDKKGVDVLLRAVAIAPSVQHVRIAGDGPDREMLEALSRDLGIEKRVEFLGHCTRDQVMREYRDAAVVVLPSRTGAGGDRDGTPVVLMEAMALSIPVVATELGGIADEVTDGHTGRLVQPDDVEGLAAALSSLLDDEGAALRIGANGAAHARQALDIATIASRLEDDLRTRLSAR